MNKAIALIGTLIAVVIAIGGYAYPEAQTVVREVQVGSVTGPDAYLPYTANNDLQTFSETRKLATATTTVCAVKSPGATSTLAFGGVRLDVSSTTASTVTLAKASTAFATTTALGFATVSANAQAAVVATSTADSFVFAPNTYFVVGMAGGTGTFSPSGSCSAQFVRI